MDAIPCFPLTSGRSSRTCRENSVRSRRYAMALLVLVAGLTDVSQAQQHRPIDSTAGTAVRGAATAVGGPASGSGLVAHSNRFPIVPAGALTKPAAFPGPHQRQLATNHGTEIGAIGVPPGASAAVEETVRANGKVAAAGQRAGSEAAKELSNAAAPTASGAKTANARPSVAKANGILQSHRRKDPESATPAASWVNAQPRKPAGPPNPSARDHGNVRVDQGGAVSSQRPASKDSEAGIDGSTVR
ncbi:hypothetical protein SBBP2_900004 [Burkholderiales bacterium]|jgi:hypothetical protein|nr:hypothetical protein SBBP2_900004 [Burkholderiales bacterium]